ncbi:MAG: capsular biosynthesis protein [Ruminococcaceae bacterium]|nr:capsular biosynthesis protein [Oscillospiraceae bacterium]
MLYYDIHCHILPGLDDGAFSETETMQMLEIAAAHNTGGIICTPHCLPSRPYTKEDLVGVFRRISAFAAADEKRLKLALGQEIFLDHQFSYAVKALEAGEFLTLNQSVYPLVEFDPYEDIGVVFAALDALRAAGFVPIVAHPERYEFVWEDYGVLHSLKQAGALLQINKGSIKGAFGYDVQQIAGFMLEERLADFVASDAHSPYRRTPPMQDVHEYISLHFSHTYADYLFSTNPLCVLRNQVIHPFGT